MKVLITGRNGQVGQALTLGLAASHQLVALDRSQCDLSNLDQLRAVMQDVRPDIVINAAAYTAVDQAEAEPELAMRINAEAPGVLAEEAKRLGAGLIHYSTDYVFDGSQPEPRREHDATGPLSVYGRSKLAGEEAIAAVGGAHLILRTSWVYGGTGKNFLLTMLRLAQTREALSIVNDQHGAPTWSETIAQATAAVLHKAGSASQLAEFNGVYHCCARGQTTWHGFAQAIFAHASVTKRPQLKAIPSSEFPTPAQRPKYSVMDTHKFETTFGTLPTWESALAECQQVMAAAAG
jgi:dTDP-4-dehydrorhamnose reductase